MISVNSEFIPQRMVRVIAWIAIALSMALACIRLGHAAEVVNLVDGTEVYPLNRLSYLEDKEGRMNLQDVMSGEGGATFLPGEKDIANFSFTKSAYWFRIDLTNQDSPIHDWLLEIMYPPLDLINVYLVDADGNAVTYRGDDK